MQKLLPFFIAFFCFSIFTKAQDVSLDLEIVCNTQDVCGQELWTGLVDFGKVNLYINEFINFEGDSLEVTITKYGIDNNLQFESPQGYDIDINTDIIFQGKIAQSTTLPFITIFENSFDIKPLSFAFSFPDEANNSFEQIIGIFTAYESSIGEVYMPNCADYITTDCFIYTLPDTLYYCNNHITNMEEICSQFLEHAYVYDGGSLELRGFVFKNEEASDTSSDANCPFYEGELVDSITYYPNYVGELSNFLAEEIQNSEDNLVVKFYVENVNTDFIFNEYINYFDIGLPVVPLVKNENCVSIGTHISTLAKEQLQLFPNPASDNFQLINIPESVEVIKVYNINGQIIANFSTPISVIDTQNWNAGYYLIQFLGKNEQFAKPLIVE